MTKRLLLIFTRNPELGKCKTRLAATIGDEAALEIYKFLLQHTVAITHKLAVDKRVYYTEKIVESDGWNPEIYTKKVQEGNDLGERMLNAFTEGFDDGYTEIVIIGSDIYDLTAKDIEQSFELLEQKDFVVGPAEDGGYYLLGMRKLNSEIFHNKKWGTSSVLEDTLIHLEHETMALLEPRNDVDVYEDIKDNKAFQPFLKEVKFKE